MLYKNLPSPASKIVYHIARRIKNHKTQSFFHAVETLADLSGVSESTARKGLHDLVKAGILRPEERQGQTTEYFFIDVAYLSNVAKLTPHPPRIYTPPPQILHPNNSSLTNSDLTTTDINVKSYNDLVKQYGKDAVDVVVESVRKRNGSVNNLTGYVIHALKNGYNPKTQEQIEEEKRKERSKKIDEQIEQSRKEQEEIEKAWEESDPEAGKKAVTEFLAKIGEVRK